MYDTPRIYTDVHRAPIRIWCEVNIPQTQWGHDSTLCLKKTRTDHDCTMVLFKVSTSETIHHAKIWLEASDEYWPTNLQAIGFTSFQAIGTIFHPSLHKVGPVFKTFVVYCQYNHQVFLSSINSSLFDVFLPQICFFCVSVCFQLVLQNAILWESTAPNISIFPS